ncbi:MAG: hypothetical protein U5L08_16520 [Xanthomonadales bacterium]|nr:hypothetical protein [Xanthomonadales bacterium]
MAQFAIFLISAVWAFTVLMSTDDALAHCSVAKPGEQRGQSSRYISVIGINDFQDKIPPSLQECLPQSIRLARSRPGVESELKQAFAHKPEGRILEVLLLTPVEEISFVGLIDLLHEADNQKLWRDVLSALLAGPPIFVDELDMGRLRSLAPEDPLVAMYYVEALRQLSREPAHWESVASEIIMENPSLLTSGRLSELNYRVDICRMREWLPEQSGEFLDALVAEVDAGQQRDIGALIEPERLSPLSVMRIVNASHPDWRQLSDAWRRQLEDNLGDWVELGLPKALVSSETWGLAQRAALRNPGKLHQEIEWFLASKDRITASYYLTRMGAHESPAVRRYAAAMQFALLPSLAAFDKMIDRGIAPELVAHEAEASQIEAVIIGANEQPPSRALAAFIANLPCDMFQGGDDPRFDAQAGSTSPVIGKWRERASECRQ